MARFGGMPLRHPLIPKNDNAAANQQYNIDVAKADLDDAQRKALQNQELLEVERQLNGIQGGIRNLNIQAEQARHQIKMNTKYGDLEAEKAKRDKLKTFTKKNRMLRYFSYSWNIYSCKYVCFN